MSYELGIDSIYWEHILNKYFLIFFSTPWIEIERYSSKVKKQHTTRHSIEVALNILPQPRHGSLCAPGKSGTQLCR